MPGSRLHRVLLGIGQASISAIRQRRPPIPGIEKSGFVRVCAPSIARWCRAGRLRSRSRRHAGEQPAPSGAVADGALHDRPLLVVSPEVAVRADRDQVGGIEPRAAVVDRLLVVDLAGPRAARGARVAGGFQNHEPEPSPSRGAVDPAGQAAGHVRPASAGGACGTRCRRRSSACRRMPAWAAHRPPAPGRCGTCHAIRRGERWPGCSMVA